MFDSKLVSILLDYLFLQFYNLTFSFDLIFRRHFNDIFYFCLQFYFFSFCLSQSRLCISHQNALLFFLLLIFLVFVWRTYKISLQEEFWGLLNRILHTGRLSSEGNSSLPILSDGLSCCYTCVSCGEI